MKSLHSKATPWLAATVISMAFSAPALADDNWPCEVALCLANPQGPTKVAECLEPIKKAWKTWAKGKSVPECKKKNKDGSTGGDLKEDGTYIVDEVAVPDTNCPFSYYAGSTQQRYCAFTGVTNQYINGQLWGRIWYGGPNGVPYIEMLHEDPEHPRPADGFEDAWKLLKGDIESKSDLAFLARKIWVDAEARAAKSEKVAAADQQKALDAANQVAAIEAWLPGAMAQAQADQQTASAAFSAILPAYVAAQEAASKPSATPQEKATYAALQEQASQLWTAVSAANVALNAVYNTQAALPQLKADADKLAQTAAASKAIADKDRSDAIAANAEYVVAEEAAKPLPEYASIAGS